VAIRMFFIAVFSRKLNKKNDNEIGDKIGSECTASATIAALFPKIPAKNLAAVRAALIIKPMTVIRSVF
jgi:sulfur relay (sulfurtransferase) DsrC/TusE family protein